MCIRDREHTVQELDSFLGLRRIKVKLVGLLIHGPATALLQPGRNIRGQVVCKHGAVNIRFPVPIRILCQLFICLLYTSRCV